MAREKWASRLPKASKFAVSPPGSCVQPFSAPRFHPSFVILKKKNAIKKTKKRKSTSICKHSKFWLVCVWERQKSCTPALVIKAK